MILDDSALRAALLAIPDRFEARPDEHSAAVLAPVFSRDGADWLLFTERRPDLARHPGQISFPGGACEGSEDPLTCALRECEEEIGLSRHAVTPLGALGSRRSTSSFRVHTIVGRIAGPPVLSPDPREVASVFAVPLADLLDEARWAEIEHVVGDRRFGRSPHFVHEGHRIWGLTGRLTADLLIAVRRSKR